MKLHKSMDGPFEFNVSFAQPRQKDNKSYWTVKNTNYRRLRCHDNEKGWLRIRVTRLSYCCPTFFERKRYFKFWQKNGLGYILSDFFTNASGHPIPWSRHKFSVTQNEKHLGHYYFGKSQVATRLWIRTPSQSYNRCTFLLEYNLLQMH
jgi:hypothetical protein